MIESQTLELELLKEFVLYNNRDFWQLSYHAKQIYYNPNSLAILSPFEKTFEKPSIYIIARNYFEEVYAQRGIDCEGISSRQLGHKFSRW